MNPLNSKKFYLKIEDHKIFRISIQISHWNNAIYLSIYILHDNKKRYVIAFARNARIKSDLNLNIKYIVCKTSFKEIPL